MIRDDPNIARALIAHKADVNDRNYEGQTPLHLACYQGNARVVACLLARRGVDARCLDRVGNNALHYAARCSTGKCMWLCLHGMHNEDDDDAQIMVDYRNNFGMTAAHVAAEYANLCALDSLRSHSADLSLTCNDDYIMLDRCVRTCGTYRGTAMVHYSEWLLQRSLHLDGERPVNLKVLFAFLFLFLARISNKEVPHLFLKRGDFYLVVFP
ncbi:hypothetical protein CYMTET_52069 [Cymbomonas tetramitiformis]|uniref:ANK_REP_REGION domain-containing protein n=1 Tax=Cymbomonas tetramitiformis TaxID=36881 RepID=A0AAE0ERP9_9CHLO|nr:hypothetical protein CYMTET_52069 [Cymbomonas tetramitiformis]